MTNNIQVVILPADAEAIETHTAALEVLLNKYVKPLSPTQREEGLKFGDKTGAFVDKVMNHAAQSPDTIPPGTDLPEVLRDYAVIQFLRQPRLGSKPVVAVLNLFSNRNLEWTSSFLW